jgi:hypothetical protein
VRQALLWSHCALTNSVLTNDHHGDTIITTSNEETEAEKGELALGLSHS